GLKSWMGSLVWHQRDGTGQYYRRNRYYEPTTNRFTQEDPIGLAGGINVYGFANGDPVNYSDPYGLSAEEREDSDCGFCVRFLLQALLRVSPRAAGAAATAGVAASRLVPGGGLAAHEAMGGHTLREHVGRTVPQLMARLAANPKMQQASAFFNRAAAESANSGALQANATKIQSWLANGGTRLVLDHQVGTAIGEVLMRGASSPVAGTGVRLVLQANSASPVGYHIVTSFVTR
ncbi:MAG: hypothetical protein M3P51_14255, partial [Chloroflexota bacterium]|nr:hypothetical protein [Chloroflexota bacterium]